MKKLLLVACAVVLFANSLVFAHSGRTDSSGGHHDYKNKSGLGSYHYHCGGYPAHLHSNGVCPYAAKPVPTSSSKTIPTPAKAAPKVYGTALKTYVKGQQIPTYYYSGDNACEVIIAEDLEYYGYDIKWVSDWNTLYIC